VIVGDHGSRDPCNFQSSSEDVICGRSAGYKLGQGVCSEIGVEDRTRFNGLDATTVTVVCICSLCGSVLGDIDEIA
jgi:hypothetical protein